MAEEVKTDPVILAARDIADADIAMSGGDEDLVLAVEEQYQRFIEAHTDLSRRTDARI